MFLLLGTFLAAVSQVMLKKAAMRKYDSVLAEYLNPLVIFAYVIFVGTTLLGILAYRGIPLSMGPVLEATSYFYVTFFGVRIFGEKMTRKKWIALGLILMGICVYALGM
ncbi:MAG: multidrug ABC transporter [Atopobiaceae bacterium]|nr:multidrug ABC transporter [Atopobiaceae bacterium]